MREQCWPSRWPTSSPAAQALRFGALFHDVAKPATRGERPDGRVTFIGHDAAGRGDGGRRSSAGCAPASGCAPTSASSPASTSRSASWCTSARSTRRGVHAYLRRCEPVEVEVTVLSCADRLATRGRRPGAVDRGAPGAGARGDGRRRCDWRAHGPPAPAGAGETTWPRELGIEPGPELGGLLAELEAATYAGEVSDARAGGGLRPPGAPESRAMIVDCAVYEDGARRDGDVDYARRPGGLPRRRTRSSGSGCTSPAEEEFDSVTREFDLHELAVEDAIHAHQRPKLEMYGDTVFVVLKTARYVDSEEVVEFGEILVFIGEDFIVTVRHGEATDLHGSASTIETRPGAPAARPWRGAARDRRPGRGRLRARDRGLRDRHRGGRDGRLLAARGAAPRSASTSSSARCSSSTARPQPLVEPIEPAGGGPLRRSSTPRCGSTSAT